ncbi:MAG: aspartyl/asparaginyl beta-hydroxylase domain-containing protein [Bacteroidia bacterium]
MGKVWFSIYDFSFDYKGSEPEFINPELFPWAADIAQHYQAMMDELKSFVKAHELPSYFNASMVNKKNTWKTIPLKTWSIERHKNQKDFPFTTSLINKYPEIISSSFNLLQARGKIHAHCGDTNAIYRCHLGLDIPKGLPDCGFKVREEKRSWENGKWLVFMDAYVHEAWNDTDEDRYIFVIDVLRPEYFSKKMYVSATVTTSLSLQRRWEKYKSLRNLPVPLLKLSAKFLRPFAQLSIHFVNFFKIY